jgi:hypothetical protein
VGAICFLRFVRSDAIGTMVAVAILIGGGVVAAVTAHRMARRLRAPVEELARSLDSGVPPAEKAGLRSPIDWEVATLYPRVRALLAEGRVAGSDVPAADEDRERLLRVCETLDRIGTDEPPGDAAHVDGALEPLGDSLRALLERLDRREQDLDRLLTGLGASVARMGEDVSRAGMGHEAAFLDAVTLGSSLKEVAQAAEMLTREAERLGRADEIEVAGERVAGMARRIADRLQVCVRSAGGIAGRLEAEATRERRLAAESAALGDDVTRARDAMVRSRSPDGAPEVATSHPPRGLPTPSETS